MDECVFNGDERRLYIWRRFASCFVWIFFFFFLFMRVFMPFSLLFSHLPSQDVKDDDRKEDWQEPRDRNWDLGNWLISCWVLMLRSYPLAFPIYIASTNQPKKKTYFLSFFLSLSISRSSTVSFRLSPRVFVFERFDRRHMMTRDDRVQYGDIGIVLLSSMQCY